MDETTITTEYRSKNKNRHKKLNSYAVSNVILLYKIADAGLLEEMRGMKISEDKTKHYYFNKTDSIKNIIERFKEQYPDAV